MKYLLLLLIFLSAFVFVPQASSSPYTVHCYYAGITKFHGGCAPRDLYFVRALCYSDYLGWHLVSRPFCM